VPEIEGCYRLHRDSKGFFPNSYLEETIKLCKTIYNHQEIPDKVRQQAWALLRGICLDNYRQLRLEQFRESLYEITDLQGITALDAELIIKYMISWIGESNLRKLRSLKPILRKARVI
jgi:hypothetical protein